MAATGGNGGFRPGLPGGSDQSKKKKVMFETMASKPSIPGSNGGLESRLSVGSPGSSFLNSSSTQSPTKSGNAKKKVKKGTTPDMARTYRFTLTLKDQNHPKEKNAYNEFNWLDLVAAEEQARVKAKMGEIVRKKAVLTGQKDAKHTLDPFASDDEDQIQALAKKFEAKYGSASDRIKKKKKARKVDDYADLGYGYDSDDSFIDDSEVHDELVPETVTTAHGGFYINSGLLEFKPRESADEDSDLEAVIKAGEMESKAAKRKRIKTKASKDGESSSDDPEERQRGTVNPLFGKANVKKLKKTDISSTKGILKLHNGN